MQYSQLGRTGATVSRLVLGTMNFGPHTSEEDSFAILDRALEQGVTFIDTANVYGGKDHKGRTEEIVGRWLQRSGKREEIVLATKVFGEMGPGANDRGLSALNIRRAVDASLRRLQTDHIDLHQVHHVDRSARCTDRARSVRSSARAPWSSWTPRSRRSTSRCPRTTSRLSTRSSPARAVRPRRTALGDDGSPHRQAERALPSGSART